MPCLFLTKVALYYPTLELSSRLIRVLVHVTFSLVYILLQTVPQELGVRTVILSVLHIVSLILRVTMRMVIV